MTKGDALRVLGLPSRVHWDEVRRAYLDLVKVWHPDRFQSDPALQGRASRRLAEINEAYEFLCDVHASQQNASGGRPRTAPKASAAPPKAEPPADHSSKYAGERQPRPEPSQPEPYQPIPRDFRDRSSVVVIIAVIGLIKLLSDYKGEVPPSTQAPTSVSTPPSTSSADAQVKAQVVASSLTNFDPAPVDPPTKPLAKARVRPMRAAIPKESLSDIPPEPVHEEAAVEASPPVAPQPPPSPVRIGGNIKPPQKTKDVRPQYPSIAQAARVQGVVIIEATIGPDGRVANTRVIRSIPLLDYAALDAVRQWEFSPTLLEGVPVPVIMTVTVQFTLR